MHPKVGKQQGLRAGAWAAAIRFHSDEDGFNFLQRFGVVRAHHPTLLCHTIFVKHPKVQGLLSAAAAPSPELEGTGLFKAGWLIEIVGVKDQRLPSCVEHPSSLAVRVNVPQLRESVPAA